METDDSIVLSGYSEALLSAISSIVESRQTDPVKINVSQTVSFFAILYERIRNSIEFREEHLIRRAAIERVLKRRLSLNPDATGEGENLVRELLWARYLVPDSITSSQVRIVQEILDKYIFLKKNVASHHLKIAAIHGNEFLLDLATCEIEESFSPDITQKQAAYLHFIYQVLRQKVIIEGVTEEKRDSYFYVACETAFLKNDISYINYHLFVLSFNTLKESTVEQLENIAADFSQIINHIHSIRKNPYAEKLARFVRKNVPAFLILYSVLDENPKEIKRIATNKNILLEKVKKVCAEKYRETDKKLKTAAVRSIVYIFLTKMIFVLLLELPLSKYLYAKIDYMPLAINSLFPPFFMGLIVSFIKRPTEQNTPKIYHRVIDILNRDPSFETDKVVVSKKSRIRRPVLLLIFTATYLLAFAVIFAVLFYILDRLHFTILSKMVFIFFITVVTFFGYRIRQTAKEYILEDQEGILSPIIYFLALPFLTVGKFLSNEIAKLNFLMLIFDVLIEAPFKLIFEIVEEWVRFVRARKEEIV